ncbi:holin [Solibacillus sp. FSL H8-0523]|uniref:holin n=1 Tax=Solibacillus sp. FSL H8-0523 TaxID=2954511 RepID=UPI003100C713
MDLTGLILVAITLVAIVTAVVEVVKKTFKIPARFLPITSIVIGILIALIVWPLSTYELYYMIVGGLIAGLAASGTFDALKAVGKKEGELK